MKRKMLMLMGIHLFKLMIEKWGKRFNRKSYFLDSYQLDSLVMFKKTLRVNQLVHFVALLINFILSWVVWEQKNSMLLALNLLLFFFNLYLCLLQEYHILRLNPLIDKKTKRANNQKKDTE